VPDTDPIAALLGERPPAHDADVRERDGDTFLVLRNEFATVWVALDRTRNGVRLVLTDADAGTSLALDPLEIEAISRMSHRDFDERILERAPGGDLPSDPTPSTEHHEDGERR
jgi:hypothetical protein